MKPNQIDVVAFTMFRPVQAAFSEKRLDPKRVRESRLAHIEGNLTPELARESGFLGVLELLKVITAPGGGMTSGTGAATNGLAESQVPGKSQVDSACPAQAADRFVMAQTPPFSCNACKDGIEQPFPFSMAFQPIVDANTGKVFAIYRSFVQ
jgi:hypothetical protein